MAYKATIELLLDVENDAEACDAIADTMRDHLRFYSPQSCIIDWRYASAGGVSLSAVEVGPIPADFEPDDKWPQVDLVSAMSDFLSVVEPQIADSSHEVREAYSKAAAVLADHENGDSV